MDTELLTPPLDPKFSLRAVPQKPLTVFSVPLLPNTELLGVRHMAKVVMEALREDLVIGPA